MTDAALAPRRHKVKRLPRFSSAIDKLLAYSVEAPNGCRVWVGARVNGGYGHVSANGRDYRAHRLAYETFVGPIHSGLLLDHLCRNPSCINPAHLEPVTNRENTLRGSAAAVNAARQLAITHCPQGHAYTGDNLYVAPKTGKRNCRKCQRDRERQRRFNSSGGLA